MDDADYLKTVSDIAHILADTGEMPSNKTALYRHFDQNDQLLYVGISMHPFQRSKEHGQRASWFEDVVRIQIEWFPTRHEAAFAEYQAIKAEKPLHNQTFSKRKRPASVLVHNPLSQSRSRPAHGPMSKQRMAQEREQRVIERRAIRDRMSSSSHHKT